MKKKQSIVTLVIMAVLTVILAYTVIVGWGDVFHTGSMKNIRTGLDLSGGGSLRRLRVFQRSSCCFRGGSCCFRHGRHHL